MMNKIILALLCIFCNIKSHADEYLWTYNGNQSFPELKEVLYDFLVKNDSSAYYRIPYTSDENNSYCFYESHYFLYSLMMALDYDNDTAFYELNRLLNKFYDENKLTKGKFYTDLSNYFANKGDGSLFKEDTIVLFNSAICNKNHKEKTTYIRSEFLNRIIKNGDTLSYHTLLDTLKAKCNTYDRTIDLYQYNNALFMNLFYSIYHIDKNHSSDGYFSLYNIIDNYYCLIGKDPSDKMKQLIFYFLYKAVKMGNKKAIIYYEKLRNDSYE